MRSSILLLVVAGFSFAALGVFAQTGMPTPDRPGQPVNPTPDLPRPGPNPMPGGLGGSGGNAQPPGGGNGLPGGFGGGAGAGAGGGMGGSGGGPTMPMFPADGGLT